MPADPIIACLREVTDYSQFERLCSDLMVLEGHPALEPLGGFKDKGRDAVHRCDASGRATVFAYSVREDWRDKLDEDAAKVHAHGHPCDRLVFLCIATFTAGERDKAVRDIKKAYQWELELYGLERIATLLRARHRHLIGQHSQVFPPAFFPPIYAGIDPAARDFVVVDYADADEVLAVWLARRLMAAGYRPWCRGLSLLPGERAPEAMEGVIRNHACRVVAVYSGPAVRDPDAQARRSLAQGLVKERGPNFFIPLAAGPIEQSSLDYKTRDRTFVPFGQSWAAGITQLVAALQATDCPRPFADGAAVASQTMLPAGVTTNAPEPLYSNCFPVTRVPEVVRVFAAKTPVDADAQRELTALWAARVVDGRRLFSFHQPPPAVAARFGLTGAGAACWRDMTRVEGLNPRHLVTELLRKSLVVRCAERGLVRVGDRSPLVFPSGLVRNDRLSYRRPDGKTTSVAVVGERSVRRGGVSTGYRYHLAPDFFVRDDVWGQYAVLLKVRVHITAANGQSLPARTAAARRRSMFKSWFNYEWFSRTLALASFLADGTDTITVGSNPDELVQVAAVPHGWESPLGIDESALDPAATDPDEVLPGRFDNDPDEEEADDGSQAA